MIRKRLLSACLALALCLSLLPVTALAAGEATTVYVGGKTLTGSADSPAYATTNDDTGEVTVLEAAPSENQWNIKWDGSTLTLCSATIKKELNANEEPLSNIAGAAIGVINQSGDAGLTITLEGTNTIKDVSAAIHVFALSGSASLTITGDGILSASSGFNPGIRVQSSTGNGTLTITGAKVTASSSYSGNGVQIRCGDSSNASLTVNGGSLTATGSGEIYAGIKLQFGSGGSGSGTPTVTVSNNAIVRANGSAGGITSNSFTGVQYGTGSSTTGGIVWNGKDGTVYGNVTLQEDLTIGEDESLNIPDGSSLNISDGKTLTVNGGELTGDVTGTVIYKVTGVSLDKTSLTLDVGKSDTLTATVEPEKATNKNVTWESSNTSVATVENGVVTAVGAGSTTIKATVDGKSAECSVTVNAATVPVTGVSLNKNTLELYTGKRETLIATVEPSDATNPAVNWSSDKPEVATVEGGTVTAKAAGTATITATTVDGGFTAICTVTVRPDVPPANPNYRITVEATQGGTVTADPTAAKAGTTVTLTPVPDRGYQVGTVAVTDRFGEAVAVTEQAGGTYTFTMPNGQVTVTVTFAEAPLPFPDVTEGDWFYDAVRYAYETGLMGGVGDSLFAPNSDTTRAQLVTILYRLAGEPEPGGDSGFSDVAAGTWYTDAVAWAAQNGIVNGVSDTEFAPGDDITREQLAAILYRYAACQGYDVSQRADLSGFGDASSIRPYAQEALSWAHAQGLVLGFEDGSLRPQGTANRAQIAAVLMRFLAAVPTA